MEVEEVMEIAEDMAIDRIGLQEDITTEDHHNMKEEDHHLEVVTMMVETRDLANTVAAIKTGINTTNTADIILLE